MSVLYHFNFNYSETERFFDDLTLGLLYALNSVMGVENVMAIVCEGLTHEEIFEWQREMEYPLPQDLISFYSLINGIHITWGYKMRNNTLLKVGLLKIESMYHLKPLGYVRNSGDHSRNDLLATLDVISDDDEPKFNTNFKIVQLECTRDSSIVCLVYSMTKNTHTIWLLDRSLQWHYITDSFTKYFYMMVKHAGLPQWQLGQTVLGMAMWAKQLMYTFALCLQSPPTTGLNSWVVDPSRAQSSYKAAYSDPTAVKFTRKKSIEYSGYFSVEPTPPPEPEVLMEETTASLEDMTVVDTTLANLETLPYDETTVTEMNQSASQNTEGTTQSNKDSDDSSSESNSSSTDTFTTTKQ